MAVFVVVVVILILIIIIIILIIIIIIIIIIIVFVLVIIIRRHPWFSNQSVPGVGIRQLSNLLGNTKSIFNDSIFNDSKAIFNASI